MPMSDNDYPIHYDFIQRAFHWSMACLILTAMALGLWASFLPSGTPLRVELLDVHKSLGMTTQMLILPRILYRLFSRVPPGPADSSPLTRAAAKMLDCGSPWPEVDPGFETRGIVGGRPFRW